MMKPTNLNELLLSYGIAVFSDADLQTPAKLFDNEEFLEDFARCALGNPIEDLEYYAQEEQLRILIMQHLFYTNHCRIVNIPVWKKAFGFSGMELPFPDKYLREMVVYVPYEGGDLDTFSTPYISDSCIGNQFDLPYDAVRSDLCPSFALSSVFNPVEARGTATKKIENKIDELDNFLNAPSKEPFLDALADFALKALKISTSNRKKR